MYDYRAVIGRCVLPHLGDREIQELTRLLLQRWQDALAKKPDARGAAQAAYAYRILRAALNDAVRLGLLPANPLRRARPAQRSVRHRAGFTMEQAEALFGAADDRWEPLFRLAFFSGLRKGELLALRWADVDMDGGTMLVRQSRVSVGAVVVTQEPKTRAGARTVPLVAPALAALLAQTAAQAQQRLSAGAAWREGDWCITSADGAPLDPANVERAFRAAHGRAGLPDGLTFHSLRHGAASVLLGAGVPTGVAAKIMGHAQVATFTDTYAELLHEASRQAAERVDAFLAARAKPAVPEARRGRHGRPRHTL